MIPSPIRILMAEDNQDHADIAINVLRDENVVNEIKHCLDGQATIDYLQSLDKKLLPGLILLDLKMPLKSGFDVLDFLQSSPLHREIPTIIMTTSSNEKDTTMAFEKGACCFLTKPFGFKEFLAALKSLDLSLTICRNRI